jgi:hypothetical protein
MSVVERVVERVIERRVKGSRVTHQAFHSHLEIREPQGEVFGLLGRSLPLFNAVSCRLLAE